MNQYLIKRLEKIDCSKIKKFSFEGIKTYAKVAKIYDPDTITIVFEYLGEPTKINIRLDGIDSPELKSKNSNESNACKKGIEKMKELIENKIIIISLLKYDKYGRILANIDTLEPINDGITNINKFLIKYNYARKYGGEKKLDWTQEELDKVGIFSE